MDPDELAQALRDERALRLAAEQRVAQLTGQVETWRTRAEERADRITALQQRAEVPWLRRAARTLRAGLTTAAPDARDAPDATAAPGATAAPAAPRGAPAPGRRGPLHPQVACVAIVAGDELGPVLAELRTTSTVTAEALASADLVVLDAAGLGALDPSDRAAVAEWARAPGRAPLVRVAGGGGRDAPFALGPAGEVVVAPRPVEGAVGAVGATLLATFDARRSHPGAGAADLATLRVEAAADGVELDTGRPGLVDPADLPGLWAAPPRWFLELAGRGLAGWPVTLDPDRGAAAARRVAMRRHAPWVATDELLGLAGVPAPARRDRVAAVLVSNRPERVATAVRRIGRSRGVDLELVIGLHGFAPDGELTAAVDALDVPAQVHRLPAAWSLGQCLNSCIEATGAPWVAKIDDDDHYGPHHLEDGLQALRYADADLVGKGAQFTYVAARDRTVLRRPRSEEVLLDGTPTGASWVLRRALWEQVGFPHRPRRVDALFLAGARAVGARVYANSRWEFCYVREGDGHTWTTDESTFLAGAEPAWEGHDPARTEVDDTVVGT